MSKELLNDSKVQSVLIKLDKSKPRELKFRQYLDDQRRQGINMKESILRLFENIDPYYPSNFMHETKSEVKSSEDIRTTNQKEEVNSSDFDMI